MNENHTFSTTAPKYILVTVEHVDPLPDWLPVADWYCYIIRQGGADTRGYKIGTLKSVTEYAESVAFDLNERSSNRKYTALRGKGKPVKPADPKPS